MHGRFLCFSNFNFKLWSLFFGLFDIIQAVNDGWSLVFDIKYAAEIALNVCLIICGFLLIYGGRQYKRWCLGVYIIFNAIALPLHVMYLHGDYKNHQSLYETIFDSVAVVEDMIALPFAIIYTYQMSYNMRRPSMGIII
ncbi:unnamed protein product [Diamesa serratosioi]